MIAKTEEINELTMNNEEVKKYTDYAIKCGLNKKDTLFLVKNIFTESINIPNELSISFLKENLNNILEQLDNTTEEKFNNTFIFNDDILNNTNSPYEIAVYVESCKSIEKLVELLKEKVKMNNFKIVYENNIFYINNFAMLNDQNKSGIIETLGKANAKNISMILKWKRKIG